MSYHKAVMRQEHDYGEIVSSIHFEEKVFEEINQEHFIEGLAEYLLEKYPSKLSSKTKRKDAFNKAEKIFKRKNKGTGLNHSQVIELVEEAIEKGYIWKFKLEEPWHYAIYSDEDRLTTVPWQHKKAVLYTGRRLHEFYSSNFKENNFNDIKQELNTGHKAEKGKLEQPEDLHNYHSVLRQGYILPGVRWASNPEEAERKIAGGADHSRMWAIYLAIDVDGTYYGQDNRNGISPVLEVEVPTKFLQVPDDQYTFTRNLQEYFEKFESPQKFEKMYRNVGSENEIQYTRKKGDYDFSFQHEKSKGDEYPVLPLGYINGVCTLNNAGTKHFMPLKEYVNLLYDHIGEKLPSRDKIRMKNGVKSTHFGRESSSDVEDRKYLKFLKTIYTERETTDSDLLSLLSSLENCKNLLEYLKQGIKHKNIDDLRTRNEVFADLLDQISGFEDKRKVINRDMRAAGLKKELEGRGLVTYLESQTYENVENFVNELENEVVISKRLELGQSAKTGKTREKVADELINKLNLLLSLKFNENQFEKLLEIVAEDKQELLHFKNLGRANESKNLKKILESEHYVKQAMYSLERCRLNIFRLRKGDYPEEEKDETFQLNSRKEEFKNLIENSRRFNRERKTTAERIRDSTISIQSKDIDAFDYLSSKSYGEIKSLDKRIDEDIEKLKSIRNGKPETNEGLKDIEQRCIEDITMISSLLIRKHSLIDLTEYLAKNKSEFLDFKEIIKMEYAD